MKTTGRCTNSAWLRTHARLLFDYKHVTCLPRTHKFTSKALPCLKKAPPRARLTSAESFITNELHKYDAQCAVVVE